MRLIATAAASILLMSVIVTSQAPTNQTVAGQMRGQHTFRYDTFGDEQLWTDTLRMHEVLPGVTPMAALSLGLKVDAEALPPPVLKALLSKQLNLNDPAVTLALLKLDAVVGVVGKVTNDKLTSVGITCALCHSTVDDSVTTGVGKRLDGWANVTLDVGRIVALSPALPGALKAELEGWGRGKYDPRHHIFTGQSLEIINSPSFPVVTPPVYGLAGVGFETYTGDGPISYWNSYVGVTQMGGKGDFSDPRIEVFVTQKPDLVTPRLPALLAYQLSLPAPPPPAGSFNADAAARGQAVFLGVGRCGTCHIPPTYTNVLQGPQPDEPFLHLPSAVGTETLYATRSATKMYRTTPLRGLWQHPPYFHDGSAETLVDVVNHYDQFFKLELTRLQKADLVEFLKTL
jgi:mono/diheme cytochrome c family protein